MVKSNQPNPEEIIRRALDTTKKPVEVPITPLPIIKESKPIEEKRTVKIVDLSTDFNASSARLIELKNNRHVDDIPLSDEYWKALKKHNAAYGVN